MVVIYRGTQKCPPKCVEQPQDFASEPVVLDAREVIG
jgi:hypothetical protein